VDYNSVLKIVLILKFGFMRPFTCSNNYLV